MSIWETFSLQGSLFIMILIVIVSRTTLWPVAVAIAIVSVLAVNRKLLKSVDYVLLVTFTEI